MPQMLGKKQGSFYSDFYNLIQLFPKFTKK